MAFSSYPLNQVVLYSDQLLEDVAVFMLPSIETGGVFSTNLANRGQRVWKRQPLGGLMALGTLPSGCAHLPDGGVRLR
jgi:hypothetical protein